MKKKKKKMKNKTFEIIINNYNFMNLNNFRNNFIKY